MLLPHDVNVCKTRGEPQAVSRRAALGLLAGAAALVSKTGPSEAAFGDAANVFGRTTNKSGKWRCDCSRKARSAQSAKVLSSRRFRTVCW